MVGELAASSHSVSTEAAVLSGVQCHANCSPPAIVASPQPVLGVFLLLHSLSLAIFFFPLGFGCRSKHLPVADYTLPAFLSSWWISMHSSSLSGQVPVVPRTPFADARDQARSSPNHQCKLPRPGLGQAADRLGVWNSTSPPPAIHGPMDMYRAYAIGRLHLTMLGGMSSDAPGRASGCFCPLCLELWGCNLAFECSIPS